MTPHCHPSSADLLEALAGLELSDYRSVFKEALDAGADSQSDADIFSPHLITTLSPLIDLSTDQQNVLIGGLDMFHRIPSLAMLARIIHKAMMSRKTPQSGRFWTWPLLPSTIHQAAPMFHIWPILGCVQDTVAFNQLRGIGAEVTLSCFRDIGRWMDHYHRSHWTWGFDEHMWMQLHIRGELHEIGRLQYNLEPWSSSVLVFRHRNNRQVAMLMDSAQEIRNDGRFQGVAQNAFDQNGFITEFHQCADGWRGNLVNNDGSASRLHEFLPAASWELALAPGDPVASFHIPSNGRLEPSACVQSWTDAVKFFDTHYAYQRPLAFTCHSWMYDATLQRYIPPDGNLRRFQDYAHLHPNKDALGNQILKFVFGSREADPQRVVIKTSLQRAVAEHLAQGGYWCQGGAVIFPDEVSSLNARQSSP